jgi:branched-chain amino acid transport system ATP-binding protein
MMLEAEGVVLRYGAHTALNGVDLSIGPGEFVSVVGPNGAGKTSLVHVLTGRLRPDAGAVRCRGRDVGGIGLVRLARLGIARSFQLVAVFPDLSVLDCLRVAVGARQRRQRRLLASLARDRTVTSEARSVAALFGLEGRLAEPAGRLSQGDKKLLDVASAFALRPEVILLDEPTSGVSTADKRMVMDTLVSAAANLGVRTIVAVEHDLDLVFAYSNRIVALHQGRVLADGPPEDVRSDDDVMAIIAGRPRC